MAELVNEKRQLHQKNKQITEENHQLKQRLAQDKRPRQKSHKEVSDCGTIIRPGIRDDQSDITINVGMPREDQFEQFARSRPPRMLPSVIKSDNGVEQNSTYTNKMSNSTIGPQVIMGVP